MSLTCEHCRRWLDADHRCPPRWETCDDYDGVEPAYGHTAEDAAIWFRADDPDDCEAVRVAVRKKKGEPWQHFEVSREYVPHYVATAVDEPDDWYDPGDEP
jgi:hypothetical protein